MNEVTIEQKAEYNNQQKNFLHNKDNAHLKHAELSQKRNWLLLKTFDNSLLDAPCLVKTSAI